MAKFMGKMFGEQKLLKFSIIIFAVVSADGKAQEVDDYDSCSRSSAQKTSGAVNILRLQLTAELRACRNAELWWKSDWHVIDGCRCVNFYPVTRT
jgi:hypothetical protein